MSNNVESEPEVKFIVIVCVLMGNPPMVDHYSIYYDLQAVYQAGCEGVFVTTNGLHNIFTILSRLPNDVILVLNTRAICEKYRSNIESASYYRVSEKVSLEEVLKDF